MSSMTLLAMTLLSSGVVDNDWMWQLVVSDGNTGAAQTYTSGQSFKVKAFGQRCQVTIGMPYVDPSSPDLGAVQSAYLYCKLPSGMSTGTSVISGPALPGGQTMLNVYTKGKGVTYRLQRLKR